MRDTYLHSIAWNLLWLSLAGCAAQGASEAVDDNRDAVVTYFEQTPMPDPRTFLVSALERCGGITPEEAISLPLALVQLSQLGTPAGIPAVLEMVRSLDWQCILEELRSLVNGQTQPTLGSVQFSESFQELLNEGAFDIGLHRVAASEGVTITMRRRSAAYELLGYCGLNEGGEYACNIPEHVWSEVQDDLSAYRPSNTVDESTIRQVFPLVKYTPLKPSAAWIELRYDPPPPWESDEVDSFQAFLEALAARSADFCELHQETEACQN